MLFNKSLTAIAVTLLAAKAQAQHVIAHVIAGNTAPSSFDWSANIKAAHDYGIEAFALDVVKASFSDGIVDKAYDAVAASGLDFKIFLQFDYAQWDPANGTPEQTWNIEDVKGFLGTYSDKPAQWKVDGKTVISTFEGPETATQWSFLDPATTLFAPDWTSAKGSNPGIFQPSYVGGALSWDVWPHAGETGVSDSIDTEWQGILNGKTYIMGVSPWFYTKLELYSKNWVARGAGLWHSRWEQVVNVNPPIVEILTWNDFGESHYIGPVDCIECMPKDIAGQAGHDSSLYVANNPHDGFAALLPAYIDAYKTGNKSTSTLDEKLVFAHTTNPVNPGGNCADDGSTALYGGAGGANIAVDAIDVYLVLNEPTAEIKVSVGGKDLTPTPLQASFRGVNHFLVDLQGASGEVQYTVTKNGAPFIDHTESPGISTDCSGFGGLINYNAITGVATPGA